MGIRLPEALIVVRSVDLKPASSDRLQKSCRPKISAKWEIKSNKWLLCDGSHRTMGFRSLLIIMQTWWDRWTTHRWYGLLNWESARDSRLSLCHLMQFLIKIPRAEILLGQKTALLKPGHSSNFIQKVIAFDIARYPGWSRGQPVWIPWGVFFGRFYNGPRTAIASRRTFLLDWSCGFGFFRLVRFLCPGRILGIGPVPYLFGGL